jgi:hypothetical protein
MIRCAHRSKHAVWTDLGTDLEPMATGRRLREQCNNCGKLLGGFLPHASAKPDTTELDIGRARTAIENERREWELHYQQREEAWRAEAEQRRERYHEYLQTDQWWDRHTLVMQRAGNLCEGCRRRTATAVHHLTYEHVTNEFLWELVAICDVCHRRVHNENQ